ncbi:hypothetical protein L226DRAFT_617780, partial [Lentinus tigrinus ALCF2SS1-7]
MRFANNFLIVGLAVMAATVGSVVAVPSSLETGAFCTGKFVCNPTLPGDCNISPSCTCTPIPASVNGKGLG